jgi:hypothetical protein
MDSYAQVRGVYSVGVMYCPIMNTGWNSKFRETECEEVEQNKLNYYFLNIMMQIED